MRDGSARRIDHEPKLRVSGFPPRDVRCSLCIRLRIAGAARCVVNVHAAERARPIKRGRCIERRVRIAFNGTRTSNGGAARATGSARSSPSASPCSSVRDIDHSIEPSSSKRTKSTRWFAFAARDAELAIAVSNLSSAFNPRGRLDLSSACHAFRACQTARRIPLAELNPDWPFYRLRSFHTASRALADLNPGWLFDTLRSFHCPSRVRLLRLNPGLPFDRLRSFHCPSRVPLLRLNPGLPLDRLRSFRTPNRVLLARFGPDWPFDRLRSFRTPRRVPLADRNLDGAFDTHRSCHCPSRVPLTDLDPEWPSDALRTFHAARRVPLADLDLDRPSDALRPLFHTARLVPPDDLDHDWPFAPIRLLRSTRSRAVAARLDLDRRFDTTRFLATYAVPRLFAAFDALGRLGMVGTFDMIRAFYVARSYGLGRLDPERAFGADRFLGLRAAPAIRQAWVGVPAGRRR
jgi:hypothetical protein